MRTHNRLAVPSSGRKNHVPSTRYPWEQPLCLQMLKLYSSQGLHYVRL